jgi:hypothetical protein
LETDPLAWSALAAAVVVAAMAFTGLIFVALSINLEPIIALSGVADFALAGLIVLTGIAISGVFILVPGQTSAVVGLEFLGVGVVFSLWSQRLLLRSYGNTPPEYRERRIWSGVLTGTPSLLLIVAGLSTFAGLGGGLYWIVPAWVIGMVAGILNAWVLLVEVKR